MSLPSLAAIARLSLPLSIALLAVPTARAQVEDVTELDPVVVTTTRTAETADETLASVTVVDRTEIDRRQSKTMTDVLRGLPGVALSNNGGPGKNTSLFLRGTNANQTLVLIDGVKVGSATTGTSPWRTSRWSSSNGSRWYAGRAPASTAPRPSVVWCRSSPVAVRAAR